MFDRDDYRQRRNAGLRGQRGVYLRGTGAVTTRNGIIEKADTYGPWGHKPVSKKAFKNNTRRARRYFRIEQEAINAGN